MVNMADIELKAKELEGLIIDSYEYRRYLSAKRRMEQEPDLKKRADEFRKRNFEVQNSGMKNLVEVRTNLMKEFYDFLKNSLVKEYLDSEIVLCRMLQRVNLIINKNIDIDIDFM